MIDLITRVIWYLIGLAFLCFVSYILWDMSFELKDHNKVTADIYEILKNEYK